MKFLENHYPTGYLNASSLDSEENARRIISESDLSDLEKRILIGTYCADLYDLELSMHLKIERHRLKKIRIKALEKLRCMWAHPSIALD